jgi:prepilin-type N-terminal cleavage/methylation domain-containing protein
MRLTSHKRSAICHQSGMTLIEILVVSLIASVVFSIVLTLTVFATRSVLAMTNYTELDQASRNTLDLLSRDIRQASRLNSYSPSQIVLVFPDTTATCTYTYDQTRGELVRVDSSGRKVLLEGCEQLKFSIYTKAPSTGFVFNSASNNISLAKLVDVSWKCSRQIRAQNVNTESIQTAKIVMRN